MDLIEDSELMKKLSEKKEAPILKEEAEEFTKKVGGFGYHQCSGKTQKGMTEIFHLCVEAGLIKQGVLKPKIKEGDNRVGVNQNPKKNGGCIIL
jgi:hypothetical protein